MASHGWVAPEGAAPASTGPGERRSEGNDRRQGADAGRAGSLAGAGLHATQERLARLTELAPDGILIHVNGRVAMVNPAAVRLAGAETADRLLGRPIGDFLQPPYLKALQSQILGPRAVGTPLPPVPDRFHRLDGSDIDVEVTATPFLDDGQPAAHLVIHDVGERVHAQASALLAASQLRLVLEQLSALVWTTGVDLQLTSTEGRPHDSIRGILGTDATLLRAQAEAVDGRSTGGDVQCNGRYLHYTVGPLRDEGGRVIGCLGMLLDNTDRLRAEEYLLQVTKNEAIGALAGGVAHEVNNMMTVVLGLCELLLEPDRLQAPERDEISEIRKAATHAARVTQQLLAFSRRSLHQPVSTPLDLLVGDLLPVIQQLLGATRRLAVTAGCPSPVRFDEGHFRQIIVNLTLNARDAMPASGLMTLRTGMEVLDASLAGHAGTVVPAGRYGVVEVRDDGAGIPADVLPRIFDPFFTTKPVGEGTGLGLAAVSGLVEQNGGFLRVESAPGRGTAFVLYLPLLSMPDVQASALEAAPGPVGALRGRKIMVVDDDGGVRGVTSRLLTRQGVRVVQAESAEEALEQMARDGAPDVILTDLTMPGMSGADLASRLAADWPETSIVLMSGYPEEAVLREVRLAGEVVLLRKPFTAEELSAKLQQAMNLRRAGAPHRLPAAPPTVRPGKLPSDS